MEYELTEDEKEMLARELPGPGCIGSPLGQAVGDAIGPAGLDNLMAEVREPRPDPCDYCGEYPEDCA